jgi:hypothetical protein
MHQPSLKSMHKFVKLNSGLYDYTETSYNKNTTAGHL